LKGEKDKVGREGKRPDEDAVKKKGGGFHFFRRKKKVEIGVDLEKRSDSSSLSSWKGKTLAVSSVRSAPVLSTPSARFAPVPSIPGSNEREVRLEAACMRIMRFHVHAATFPEK
jgi:hypothetical protein